MSHLFWARVPGFPLIDLDIWENLGMPLYQWEFQDPKMELLCHIIGYSGYIFGGISPYLSLIYGRYNSNLGS